MNFAERIVKIRQELKLSQKDIAEKLGVSQNAISQYETGKREPSLEGIHRIAEEYNINLQWLITGRGEPFLDSKEKAEKKSRAGGHTAPLTDAEHKELCDIIRQLPARKQKKVYHFVQLEALD